MRGLNLVVLGIAFHGLSNRTLGVLEAVKLPLHKQGREAFEHAVGCALSEFAYIEKCNAVLLVMDFTEPVDDLRIERSKQAWCTLAGSSADMHRESMVALSGRQAHQYLLETAVGLHSVVIGDTQVYSQVRGPIATGASKSSKSTFRNLMRLMREAESKVSRETRLHRGYTSLERLACLRIQETLNEAQAVAVVGLGSSGRLVAKILCEKQDREVFVAARSHEVVDEVTRKYSASPTVLNPLAFVSRVRGIVLALDCNEETRRYAKDLQKEVERIGSLLILIDLASPPLLKWAIPNCQIVDITGLSEMAQKVVAERKEYTKAAKNIVRTIITDAFNTVSAL